MALALDASTPAAVHNATNVTTVTTAAFSPPAGSVIVVLWPANDDPGVSQPGAPSITDSLGSHLVYTQSDWSRAADTANTGNGQVAIWSAPCPSAQANMTITVTTGNTNPTSGNDGHLRVQVWTGADTSTPIGAHGKSGGASQTGTATYAATRIGSIGELAFADWNASASHPTLQSGNTEDSWTTLSGQETGWVARQTTASTSVGQSVTLGATAPTVEGRYAYVEILPSVSADPPGGYQPLNPIPPPLLFELVARNQAMWQTSISGPQSFSQSFDGSISPDGALANLVTKPGFAGTVGPTGTLAKQANKALSGTLTSSGSLLRTTLKALAGTAASAGALAKAVTKPGLAGSSTPAGTLAKRVNKALSGTLTSSGALSTVKVVLRSFAGTLTSSGALAKQANKALTGSASSTGALTRQAAKALSGALTPSGALAKRVNKALAGMLTPSGALSTTKVVVRAFAGTMTSSGALTKQAAKAFAGSLAPSGALARMAAKALAGAVAPAGSLAKLVRRVFGGSIAPTGAVSATTVGATKNATSAPVVLESRTSTPDVAARDSSLPGVTGKASSTPSTAAGRSSAPGVSGTASSNPSVSDG